MVYKELIHQTLQVIARRAIYVMVAGCLPVAGAIPQIQRDCRSIRSAPQGVIPRPVERAPGRSFTLVAYKFVGGNRCSQPSTRSDALLQRCFVPNMRAAVEISGTETSVSRWRIRFGHR